MKGSLFFATELNRLPRNEQREVARQNRCHDNLYMYVRVIIVSKSSINY